METVVIRAEPRIRSDVYAAYWHFAAERQLIFERRLEGLPEPWTDDEILLDYRFCNSFRASDRVSQYLIREVIYGPPKLTPEDRFFRTIFFRLFSRPETWELIEQEAGPVSTDGFDPVAIGALLDKEMEEGRTLYTNAFILCANRAYGHRRKHRNHLALLEAMLSSGLLKSLLEAESLQAVFEALREFPLIGDFMAYQLATDLNYGPDLDFDENDFTIPGPGAIRGLSKVFLDLGDYSPAEAILWLVDRQDVVSEEIGIDPPTLFGRPLHAIDCQNLLCEIDKYARVRFPELPSNRTRIKQRFVPAGDLPSPVYPPRWELGRSRSAKSSSRLSRRTPSGASKKDPPATTSSSPNSRPLACAT
jgi:alpha-glutamyl/putrescinyl thymine pyrophosphorylase clade 1